MFCIDNFLERDYLHINKYSKRKYDELESPKKSFTKVFDNGDTRQGELGEHQSENYKFSKGKNKAPT